MAQAILSTPAKVKLVTSSCCEERAAAPQDHDVADAFTELFEDRPATLVNGSKQIDLMSVSCRLAPCVDRVLILSPASSEGDHSAAGTDFNFGGLTDNANLSEVDPGHV